MGVDEKDAIRTHALADIDYLEEYAEDWASEIGADDTNIHRAADRLRAFIREHTA